MSLRSKVIAILAVFVALLAISQLAVQRLVLLPSFEELEARQAEEDLQRIVEALASDAVHLEGVCRDWASWDATYQFSITGDPAYVEENLQPETLENNRLTLLVIVSSDGRVVGRLTQPPDDGEAPLALAEFPEDVVPAEWPLWSGDGGISGMLVTRDGPMVVASRPILTSTNDGPPRGSLVMGRLIGADELAVFRDQTKVVFDLECLPAADSMGAERSVEIERVAAGGGTITPIDDRTNEVLGVVRDVHGRPAVLVRARVPRSVTQEGADTLRFAILSTGGATLLTLLVVLVLLQRVVVAPLSALTRRTVAIGAGGDLGARLRMRRADEIGLLAGEIDAMMERLEASHRELLSAARIAGMSEVAANVLHDVGNALNGVNVSAEMVRRKLDLLGVGDLRRICDRLHERSGDLAAFLTADPKGRRYPEYLDLLARSLEEEREALRGEARAISEGLAHIKTLVRSQQDLAGGRESPETVSPEAEMEAALKISGAAAGAIEVVRDYAAPDAVRVQRHRLLQILVNLLKNARQAIDERAPEEKRLTLRVRASGGRLFFEVEDNGVGIAPENLIAVFTRGFTTKPNGNGIGLHSAANLARDMGGALAIRGTAVGVGTTFALELPLEPREAREAA